MYKLLLCWRYLLTRYLALVCIISVMLGVATLIVVNSVMSGFSTKLRDRLHGLLSDVVIEAENYEGMDRYEMLLADIRAAMGPEDIVLADTGAVKMWMARLYPTYKPNTCLISNGLASMAFAIPGAVAAKLAFPQRKVLAVVGDGAFMMSSQEIETAMREKIPIVILIWEDGCRSTSAGTAGSIGFQYGRGDHLPG